ncbi:keywimysin-related RiPP [Amycolatopsis sp. EV170708-02-1]
MKGVYESPALQAAGAFSKVTGCGKCGWGRDRFCRRGHRHWFW